MDPVRHRRYERTRLTPSESNEVQRVDDIASRLEGHLEDQLSAISAVHVFRAQSKSVQGVVSQLLRDELGFEEEVVIRPSDGFVTRARPDFFYELSDGRGIIAEVERGGTTSNNHDLKDVWKAHISPTRPALVPGCTSG